LWWGGGGGGGGVLECSENKFGTFRGTACAERTVSSVE